MNHTGWSVTYFQNDATHYRVIDSAKARLIDTSTNKVAAEGFCKRAPDSEVDAPTYDKLLTNGALRIKKELSLATQYCVAALKTEMLAL